eukprot:gene16240-22007_t
MGRSHPFGIVLASILFGALYQGGAELAFEKPTINRDMIVVIQGLVDTGPLGGGRLMDLLVQLPVIFDSAIRLSVPLIFCCLAGLYSERSGVVDIGLEGKMLVAAFAAGVMAHELGSAWLGLAAGILTAVVFALVHGVSAISYRGNQIVSGV